MKKIFFLILGLVLFSRFVFGDLSDVHVYWTMDNSEVFGSTMYDITGNGYNGTITGATTGQEGILGEGFDFESGDNQDKIVRAIPISNYPVSMNIWIKPESLPATAGSMMLLDASDATVYWGHHDITARAEVAMGNTGHPCGVNNAVEAGSWQMVTVILANATYRALYINATFQCSATTSDAWNANLDLLQVGSERPASNWWDGLLDEFGLWDRVLSPSEITELWNSGSGLAYPFGSAPETPSLTLTSNGTSGNYTDNYYVGFSGSVSNTDDNNFNCTIYLNNSVDYSFLPTNISETQTYLFDYCLDEHGYNVNITCFNNNSTDEILINDLFLDCVPPSLVISTNFVNNTNYYDNTNLNFNITAIDDNLFYFSVNISDITDDSLVFNEWYENITINEFIINITNSTSDIGTGQYKITAFAGDSHTDNIIREISQTYKNEQLIINNELFFYDDDIKFFNDENKPLTYFYLSENKEKYKMKVTWNTESLQHQIYITANDYLTFLPESKYKGHFVFWHNLQALDFESKNIESIRIDELGNNVFRINLYHYSATDELEIESLYDLNINEVSWFFNITSAPTLSDVLLADINETNYLIKNSLYEIKGGIEMLPLMLAMLVFFILGLMSFRFLISISGAFGVLISVLMGKALETATLTSSLYYKYGSMFFMFFGLMFLILGSAWQLIEIFSNKKKRKNSFYDLD